MRLLSTVITCSGGSWPQGVSVGCSAFAWVKQRVCWCLCVWAGGVESVAIFIFHWGVCVYVCVIFFFKCARVYWGAVCAVTFSAGRRNHNPNIATVLPCPEPCGWVDCDGDKSEREREGGMGRKANKEAGSSSSYKHISLRQSRTGKWYQLLHIVLFSELGQSCFGRGGKWRSAKWKHHRNFNNCNRIVLFLYVAIFILFHLYALVV